MIKLTIDHLNEAPDLVIKVMAYMATGSPMPLDLYNKALDEYPEYFPEEVAKRDKWRHCRKPQQETVMTIAEIEEKLNIKNLKIKK